MAERSIFAPGGGGATRGGLDRYLGPAGIDDSSLLPVIEDPQPDTAEVPVDCAGADKDEAVCAIARAEQEAEKAG
jgi:hypothetical protein